MQAQQLTFSCQEPVRLDLFLARSNPAYSRTFWQKLIAQNGVAINGKLAPNGRIVLKVGDTVDYDLNLLAKPTVKPDVTAVKFETLLENEDFVAINKPAGLLVHSTSPSCTQGSLFEFLSQKYATSELCLERAGLIHRLDKETSGIMIIAKNPSSQFMLSKLFAERKIVKTYLAVVLGHPDPKGSVDKPLGRHPHARHKRAIDGIGAKPSLTEFEVQEYFEKHSLLKINLATGRTHQIRVHLASIGHPVLGDFLYGQQTHLIARQALHAASLEFSFNNQFFKILAPVPDDMQQLLSAKAVK